MIDGLLRGSSAFAKLCRYGIAGGASSLFYGLCAWILVTPLAQAPIMASIAAYLLAVPVSFILQRWFAFRSRGSAHAEAPRFLLVHGLNILASAVVMQATLHRHASALVGVVITMALIPLFSFAIMHLWVFPTEKPGDRRE